MKQYLILVINPGSTSTKIAVFRDRDKLFQKTLRHSAEELAQFKGILDQTGFRKNLITSAVQEAGINIEELACVAGRGGLLEPMTGGTYSINTQMLIDLKKQKRGAHASNMGALIAQEIATDRGIPAFIVDPVCVDELEPLARLSGIAEIPRQSLFHALNQKAIARRAAQDTGRNYEDMKLLVAHLGGGITVGVHDLGRVVDVNDAIGGDGPYSPERSGGVPVGGLVNICFSGDFTREEIMKKIVGGGGLVSYLGVNDALEIEARIHQGDEQARLVYEGMAYQVAKEIGSASTVVKGNIDLIVLTGGLAHSKMLTDWIIERVQFIAPVKLYPGEDEMEALAAGALRVLTGEETAKVYKG